MIIKLHKNFIKNYNSRIKHSPKLVKEFNRRSKFLLEDERNPLLKIHKLTGDKADYMAFSLGGDLRVILIKTKTEYIFYDIGTHNQVY